MTKKEKIKEKFLNNPVSLKLREIETFLISEWFELIEAKWSHKKVKHKKTWKMYILPIHNSDVLNVYKKKLLEFYNNI